MASVTIQIDQAPVGSHVQGPVEVLHPSIKRIHPRRGPVENQVHRGRIAVLLPQSEPSAVQKGQAVAVECGGDSSRGADGEAAADDIVIARAGGGVVLPEETRRAARLVPVLIAGLPVDHVDGGHLQMDVVKVDAAGGAEVLKQEHLHPVVAGRRVDVADVGERLRGGALCELGRDALAHHINRRFDVDHLARIERVSRNGGIVYPPFVVAHGMNVENLRGAVSDLYAGTGTAGPVPGLESQDSIDYAGTKGLRRDTVGDVRRRGVGSSVGSGVGPGPGVGSGGTSVGSGGAVGSGEGVEVGSKPARAGGASSTTTAVKANSAAMNNHTDTHCTEFSLPTAIVLVLPA